MAKFLIEKTDIDASRYEIIEGPWRIPHLMFEGVCHVLPEYENRTSEVETPYITILRSNVKSTCGIWLSMKEADELILQLVDAVEKIKQNEAKAKSTV